MRGLIYLYQRTIINRVKYALKRPVSYIMGAFLLFYIVMMFFSFQMMIEEGQSGSAENVVTILSGIILLLIPGNIIAYSKRKGLIFRPSEVHFVFSAPVSPKMVLMFAGVKSFAVNILIGVIVAVLGIMWFHVGVLQALGFFVFFAVFESILEASLIIFCYGNERFGEKFFKRLVVVMYLFMAVIAGVAVFLLITKEPSFQLIQDYFALPVIQLVPIVGWTIAWIRLLFLGADTVSLIGTVLYLITVLLVFLTAFKTKCTGAYYEDAMKFADDYQKIKQNQKKGVANVPWKKKQKLREATIVYKGTFAKAIYFRQILEYKKNPTFIFGWNSLLCFGLGIAIAVVGYFNDAVDQFGAGKIFIIPGVVAYVTFIFTGYATKWSKELENPYTYLIPDTPLKKVWYATKIEHYRAIVDGILVTVPGAVVFEIGPVMTVLTVLLYICLQANRLYYNMLADALVGNVLGSFGRSMVKLLFQGMAMGIGITAAAMAGVLLGVETGFLVMIAVMAVLTFAGAAIASVSFTRMEVME
ncbi:putative ABC exporter domain-containing protein [Lachnospiraceae bacterium 45-W7]